MTQAHQDALTAAIKAQVRVQQAAALESQRIADERAVAAKEKLEQRG